MLYRANILLAETDEDAQELLEKQRNGPAPLPMRAGVRDALLKLDSRNVAGEARAPNVGGVLPTSFYGSPDTVVEQIKRCREEVGGSEVRSAGVAPVVMPDPLHREQT